MTIGIACSGPDAVAHVLRVLRGVELLGTGAIGGFAVLAVMLPNGQVVHAQTQQGGSTGLRVDSSWRSSERAAIISSGPDRPEPLTQFLPGVDGVGLVTGHRLPNRPFEDSRLNLAVLDLMRHGVAPGEAVAQVLAAYPECDAGLMALSAQGEIACANSARVQRRFDTHRAVKSVGDTTLALMMNSIYFAPGVTRRAAEMLGELAWPGRPGHTSLLDFAASCPVSYAAQDAVVFDRGSGEVVAIRNADPLISRAQGRWPVVQNGCRAYTTQGDSLGVCLHDVVGDVRDGRVSTLRAGARLQVVIGEQS